MDELNFRTNSPGVDLTDELKFRINSPGVDLY